MRQGLWGMVACALVCVVFHAIARIAEDVRGR
jgi:hypothetical protein